MAVYFLRAGKTGPVKIGHAVDPWKRLRQLQGAVPHKLIMLAVIAGDIETERHYHSAFADSRLRGEWFFLTDAMQNFLLAQPRVDLRPEPKRGRPLRVAKAEAKKVWFDHSIPTNREAARKAGVSGPTLLQWFGPSGRPRREYDYKAMSIKGTAAYRAKILANRIPREEAEAKWRDVEQYPNRADALKAMPGWSLMTAWRTFGAREKK